MALSLAEIIILSLLIDWLFKKFRIPGLVGMLLLGIILGPFALRIINPELIAIGSDLRLIALIIILLRAGFAISRETLNRVGKIAFKLSFIPATCEALSITVLAPHLFGITYLESAVLGFVISAVSPAIVVTLMLRFIEEGRGVDKGIPTLILAGASMDNVYSITVYSALISIYVGQKVKLIWKMVSIPISICLGICIGLIAGLVLLQIFERFNPRATKRVLMLLGVSILLVRMEVFVRQWLSFAPLLAVMAIGFIILEKREKIAHEISRKLSKIWIFAEILLFVMAGAQVNIKVVWQVGLKGVALLGMSLIFRSLGTYCCVLGSHLNFKERMFVIISYMPKATVQAAIGAAPLAAMRLAGMNTSSGELILAMAVLSILLTAPLGSCAICLAGDHLLTPKFNLY